MWWGRRCRVRHHRSLLRMPRVCRRNRGLRGRKALLVRQARRVVLGRRRARAPVWRAGRLRLGGRADRVERTHLAGRRRCRVTRGRLCHRAPRVRRWGAVRRALRWHRCEVVRGAERRALRWHRREVVRGVERQPLRRHRCGAALRRRLHEAVLERAPRPRLRELPLLRLRQRRQAPHLRELPVQHPLRVPGINLKSRCVTRPIAGPRCTTLRVRACSTMSARPTRCRL